MWQLDPFYRPAASTLAPPMMSLSSKWYYSQDALDVIHGAQEYIAALARHDLRGGSNVYVAAAFDLAAPNPNVRARGCRDWVAFCRRGSNLLVPTPAVPITWGEIWVHGLGSHARRSATQVVGGHTLPDAWEDRTAVSGAGAVAAPTLWLTTRLRGGAPKVAPASGWCKTRHRRLKAAQSGYDGRCKTCYKEKFPE